MNSIAYPRYMIPVEAGYVTPAFVPGKPYVLVIDDDYAILSVIMLLLETEGYAGMGMLDSRRVQPFLAEARSPAPKTGLPTVILLDMMMPGISGYEHAAWIAAQEWGAPLPIVAMTADPTAYSASAICGTTDFVSKPFHLDTLLGVIERYITPTCLP